MLARLRREVVSTSNSAREERKPFESMYTFRFSADFSVSSMSSSTGSWPMRRFQLFHQLCLAESACS